MQSKLVTCNLELMGVIQENEGDVHDQVTALLEQYEKFRVSLSQTCIDIYCIPFPLYNIVFTSQFSKPNLIAF